MGEQTPEQAKWGGQLWIVALVAIVLTILILAFLFPRFLAYQAPAPTAAPWTQAPGAFDVPTPVPPEPTIVSPFITPAP